MKKYLVFLCIIICLLFSACSADSNNESSTISEKQLESQTTSSVKGTSEADVDLTNISSTMMYAEISNILTYPDNYVGKSIKMAGKFTMWYDEETSEEHYACYIMDTTACCQQGFEFVLTDNSDFENMPALDSDIEVIGTFETYSKDDLLYCRLVNASVTVL